MLATPAWAMAIPFRESSFVMLVPLRILPASLVYAYQHLLRCGTTVPTLHTMPISHFPLILRFAMRFYPMRTTSLLYNRFRSGGSLCFIHCAGFRHQRSFRPVSAFCSLVSLPNSVFGATEPVFGATDPVFGEPFISFRTLVSMLGSKTQRFRSIKSAHQSNSIPNSAFMGFRWILFAQRGDIFSGRVPCFEFMALSLFFQKW